MEKYKKTVKNCLKTGEPWDIELRILDNNGVLKYCRAKGVVENDVSGKPIHFSGTLLDITKMVLSEEKLRLSEEHFHSIVMIINEGIVYKNIKGEITSANPAAERIFGASEDKLKGKTSEDFAKEKGAIKEDGSPFQWTQHPCTIALSTGKPQLNVVMGIHNVSGSVSWLVLNSYPLTRSGESKPYSVVTTFRDITITKQAEEKLKNLNRIKDVFLSMSTHGLKAPLTPIKAQAQLLLAGYYGEINEKQKEAISMIYRNEEVLNRLSDDVMDVSKIKSLSSRNNCNASSNIEVYGKNKNSKKEARHVYPHYIS